MSNTFDKLSVLDSFIEEVNSYLPEIEANLERLAESPGDMEALEETYRRTHTIGGSASMMDFPGLSHVAHGMEDILGDALDATASLDPPTISFLQRSLRRLHRLVEGIRGGVDQDAVIAEDDADYTQYRLIVEATEQTGQQDARTSDQNHAQTNGALPALETPAPTTPSLDEVLASFRTPHVTAGEEMEWPEDVTPAPVPSYQNADIAMAPTQGIPVQTSSMPAASVAPTASQASQIPSVPSMPAVSQTQQPQHVPAASQAQQAPAQPQAEQQPTSALEMLVATTRKADSSDALPSVPVTPMMPVSEGTSPSPPRSAPVSGSLTSAERRQGEILPGQHPVQNGAFLQAYSEMQGETRALQSQAASLKNLIMQLRQAAEAVETQRAEFKGFLDGSKDALDRMEDWAGRAMGLNLKNSPEQVRRFLPLSVMWVSNIKLKDVLQLLSRIIDDAQMTDEQMHTAVQQLQTSLISCGAAFQQATTASHTSKQESDWTPWEMQVMQDAAAVRERVTFERQGNLEALRAQIESQLQGDIAAMRAQVETQVREEVRQEYEARQTSLAARAELERQVREEVRQEFEAKRKLQERVIGTGDAESLQELEARLRSEIEIEVRQDFLNQITEIAGGGEAIANAQSLMPPTAVTRTSNFLDQAREATGISDISSPASMPAIAPTQQAQPTLSASVAPAIPAPPPTVSQPAVPAALPPQISSSTTPSASAFSGDFGEEAADIFRLEAEEHLQTISMHVAALEKSPMNRELIQGIRRATHTLKGAAGMMGFRAIADLSHVSEDLLDSIMEGTTTVSPAVLSLILDTAETLDLLISGLGADDEQQEAKVQELRSRYAALLGEQNISLNALDEELDSDLEANDEALEDASNVTGVVAGAQAHETNAQRAARGDLSVRVRLQKLDELVNLFGELLVNRSILEERLERLNRFVADAGMSSNRLRDIGQRLESRFEAATLPSGRSVQVMPGEGDGAGRNGNGRAEPAHIAEFDELELDRYTEFHQLARGLSECVSDMTTLSTEMEGVIRDCEGVFGRENRLSTTFQDRLMKARLVPLSSMTPRLYRAARAVALKQHKEFEFLLEGQETEVDRTVYEEIAGPLLHLMRNAVNHAIETPEVREAKGKSPIGHITLSALYEGNQVVITIKDDGTGIDPNSVRMEAIARGLVPPDQVLSDSDVLELIFRPGFSTASVLSEESGRGVGLDVVRDSVARLRGTLVVDSTPGQGTAFTMKFPTSLAIQSAMMVMASGQQFAIPTVMVEAIGRLDNYKQMTYGGRPAVMVRNDLYPLNMLAQYLNLPVETPDEKAPVLLISSGDYRVALVVDDIKGKMDVVMKNLGPHLRAVHGIAGGTVLGNGRVVLILELLELLSTRPKGVSNVALPKAPAPTPVPVPARGESASAPASALAALQAKAETPSNSKKTVPITPVPAATTPAADRGKHVLVVDDSPSVRRVVSSMLKQHGWETQMARDGVEALEMISQQAPAAVLLDIEMPRMDGYELMATVRSQEQYRTLPLVVLTSRAAAKHQQRAMQLGANAYVVKPYQDEELINTLNALIFGAAV
ncbi:MAG TPA: response regulator [Ktedonobacteraceae bacterium]|nr:response regulator [Ktedonobacteraceae bacterium]